MAEARAATLEPKVRFHDEGTSEIEQETKVAKSFFQDLKLCAVRTRWVLETTESRGVLNLENSRWNTGDGVFFIKVKLETVLPSITGVLLRILENLSEQLLWKVEEWKLEIISASAV